MRTALLVFALCCICWTAQAQTARSHHAPLLEKRLELFNIPVTERGYVMAPAGHGRILNAVEFVIRPETATVFGLVLTAAPSDTVLALSYDLSSEHLSAAGTRLESGRELLHPLVNNALQLRVDWTDRSIQLSVDGEQYPIRLGSPLPAALQPTFFVDAGMVQVTQYTAWYHK